MIPVGYNIGTAMGTPVACIYAILFFGYFERKIILHRFKNNLLLYVRQIDDIFGVWKDSPDDPNAWEEFKRVLNGVCNLKWKTTALRTKVDFLDLTILIDSSGNLWTRTFQKPMC